MKITELKDGMYTESKLINSKTDALDYQGKVANDYIKSLREFLDDQGGMVSPILTEIHGETFVIGHVYLHSAIAFISDEELFDYVVDQLSDSAQGMKEVRKAVLGPVKEN